MTTQTIAELQAILAQYPPDTLVMVQGYEGGYEFLRNVEFASVKLNVNTEWYYGAHEIAENNDGDANAVLLLGGETLI
jgi:hypothetical protein